MMGYSGCVEQYFLVRRYKILAYLFPCITIYCPIFYLMKSLVKVPGETKEGMAMVLEMLKDRNIC